MKLFDIVRNNRLHFLRRAQYRSFPEVQSLLNARKADESTIEQLLDSKKSADIKAVIKEAHTTDPGSVESSFPSDQRDHLADEREYTNWLRDQAKHSYRPKIDPRKTSILLFPGQGSQFVGMGLSLLKYPNVNKMYKIASDILGYDLLDVSTKGPVAKLNKTIHCQPAILVASLAAVEKLRDENPQVGIIYAL